MAGKLIVDGEGRWPCYKQAVRHALIMVVPLVALLACARSTAAEQAKDSGRGKNELPHARIGIETATGSRYALDVEVANTDASRERGLMFRRQMPEDAGMIFIFDTDKNQTFWMKNTFIPLDMLFIDVDGRIIGIVPEATPQTESIRSVKGLCRYVLEVNGGWAALKGVHAGDRVELSEALTAGR